MTGCSPMYVCTCYQKNKINGNQNTHTTATNVTIPGSSYKHTCYVCLYEDPGIVSLYLKYNDTIPGRYKAI